MKIIILTFILLSNILNAQDKPFLIILGNAQDAGAPQAMCQKDCCKDRWKKGIRYYATSFALMDPSSKSFYFFEISPDFKYQYQEIQKNYPTYKFEGIFITHAHVGHYAGLIHLGREIVGAKGIPVYVMPRMANFLKTNGPWSQLVTLKNINIIELKNKRELELKSSIKVSPFLVPHRDEYSETVGYKIKYHDKQVTFIPDINKWQVWNESIIDYIKQSDLSILDGSFYNESELPGRNMAEIPHPYISESLALFKDLSYDLKSKIMFIHFNHTNPLLEAQSKASIETRFKGYKIAKYGDRYFF